jgi:hypothetical protein
MPTGLQGGLALVGEMKGKSEEAGGWILFYFRTGLLWANTSKHLLLLPWIRSCIELFWSSFLDHAAAFSTFRPSDAQYRKTSYFLTIAMRVRRHLVKQPPFTPCPARQNQPFIGQQGTAKGSHAVSQTIRLSRTCRARDSSLFHGRCSSSCHLGCPPRAPWTSTNLLLT